MDKYKVEGDKIYERVTEWNEGKKTETWKLICTCVDDETADEIAGILNAHEWAS